MAIPYQHMNESLFKADIRSNEVNSDGRKHSYSGIDITAIMYFPQTAFSKASPKTRKPNSAEEIEFDLQKKLQILPEQVLRNNTNYRILGELQTISVSTASAIFPVRSLGYKRAKTFSRGARVFSGSMVFSVLDRDIFYEALDIAKVRPSNDKYFLDQLPEFDIILQASNEYGDIAIKVITGITFTHTGEVYSVDDLYLESTYTYIARHASPLIKLTDGNIDLLRPNTSNYVNAGDMLFPLRESNPIIRLNPIKRQIYKQFDNVNRITRDIL